MNPEVSTLPPPAGCSWDRSQVLSSVAGEYAQILP
jgi:hypothetical protein